MLHCARKWSGFVCKLAQTIVMCIAARPKNEKAAELDVFITFSSIVF